MMMQTRPLGQSGIDASVVGFGAWAIGGWMWGGTSQEESINAVHAALDAGINLIDTAPIYGFGISESVLGAAISGRRDKVVLATKCGMVTNTGAGEHKFFSDANGPAGDGHIDVRIWLHPDSIRWELERSLQRLGTDYVDLYQTHWQEATTPIEDTMATLLDLKQEGKIRAIGVSNATVEHMDAYRACGPLDSDQEKYNMLDRAKSAENLAYAHEHGVAVLAYSPLAKGLLTGKMPPEREFLEGDQRNTQDRFSRENRAHVCDMLDKFRDIAERYEASLAQLCIAWTFHQPGLSHVLAGARHPHQARENASAGALRLTEQDLGEMHETLAEYAAVLV